jgi:hypothetical protein
MPIDPSEVHVTGDPLVVTIFVALFAGAVVLAIAFALYSVLRGTDGVDDAVEAGKSSAPRDAGLPWSTTVADDSQPWAGHRSKAPRD